MVTTNNALLLMLVFVSGFFDAKERKIPNKITFTGIMIGIDIQSDHRRLDGIDCKVSVGMFAGLAIFFLPFVMGGMGAGDVKLMGAIGALMGWRFSLMTALVFRFGRGCHGAWVSAVYREIKGHLKKNDCYP